MSTRKVYIYIYIEYSSHHEFHSRIKSNCNNAAFLNNVDQKCPREREREREIEREILSLTKGIY